MKRGKTWDGTPPSVGTKANRIECPTCGYRYAWRTVGRWGCRNCENYGTRESSPRVWTLPGRGSRIA